MTKQDQWDFAQQDDDDTWIQKMLDQEEEWMSDENKRAFRELKELHSRSK